MGTHIELDTTPRHYCLQDESCAIIFPGRGYASILRDEIFDNCERNVFFIERNEEFHIFTMTLAMTDEDATEKFNRLCEEDCSKIGEEDLDFLESVFKMMGAERKSSFFEHNSMLAVKVVGRNGKTPGTVSVNGDGDTNVSDLSSIATDETSEMHQLYATVTYQETFNKHVWRSIGVCLKDRVFPKVKFWKDTKTNFIMPDFRTHLPKNKHEQSRKVCEMLMDFVSEKDQGNVHSMRKKVAFWKLYAPLVRAELVDYRANAAAQVRKAYMEGK